MTPVKHLPRLFCWTKVGAEAGEDVQTIVRRKEWERELGSGRFFWGIGQALGSSVYDAASLAGKLEVYFSPMRSKAKNIDSAPDGVVLWTAWIDLAGHCRPLPMECFVTSRSHLPSGRQKS